MHFFGTLMSRNTLREKNCDMNVLKNIFMVSRILLFWNWPRWDWEHQSSSCYLTLFLRTWQLWFAIFKGQEQPNSLTNWTWECNIWSFVNILLLDAIVLYLVSFAKIPASDSVISKTQYWAINDAVSRAHTNGGVQQRTLLKRVVRKVREIAFEKVLRKVLRKYLAMGFNRKKGFEGVLRRGFREGS